MISSNDIEWKFIKSLGLSRCHSILYRDNNIGLQFEKHTPIKANYGGTGTPKNYFFIDNDEREFFSEDELIEAYNDKFKHNEETPTHEIKYVKILVRRNDI